MNIKGTLKGVLAKNEILLLSVASIRRKLLKTTYTEKCSIQIQKLQYTSRIVK